MVESSSKSCCRQGSVRVNLAALLSNITRRIDPDAWKAICPGLSISATATNYAGDIGGENTDLGDTKIQRKYKRKKEKLIRDGYALVNDSFDVRLVREGIEALHKQDLPATFILLFNESWHLACQSKRVLEKATHERNIFNYDLLAWYISPGSPGFSPHRDRQPDDPPSTFHSDDHEAKFVTNWIALSDATPENSCLYVIPKPYDPGYTTGDIDNVADDKDSSGDGCGDRVTDPLHRALPSKESFQHIRSLPRKAGQSILFTHRIIHWGSQGDPTTDDDDDDDDENATSTTAVSPRIAISFVCSDPDYEAPLLVNHAKYFSSDPNANADTDTPVQFPPLHIRLLLVCAQLLIYYQRFDLEKSVIKACYEFCKQHEEELEETYRRKVYVEFVNAMKEQKGQGTSNNTNREYTNNISTYAAASTATKSSSDEQAGGPGNHGDDDEDDDEDAMLEELLNAEADGYGEFEDDYDETEQGEGEIENGDDDEEDDDEEEGDFGLFGGRKKSTDIESPVKKKAKTFIT